MLQLSIYGMARRPLPLRPQITVVVPLARALIEVNTHLPSIFLIDAFPLKQVWDVVYDKHIHVKVSASDPSLSSTRTQYHHINFGMMVRRKSGYFVTNVFLPMISIYFLTVLSIGAVEEDGTKLGTADRLSITLTLLLTAVAYKFVVASMLPPVSYLTYLDTYVLICLGMMLGTAIENVVYPWLASHGSSSSIDESVVVWMYVAALLLMNLVFSLFVFFKVRASNREQYLVYEQLKAVYEKAEGRAQE